MSSATLSSATLSSATLDEGLIQGRGRTGALDLQTPAMIRFGENTSDEVFISSVAATAGVEFENTGTEPLVGLRYFGPDTHNDLPIAGS